MKNLETPRKLGELAGMLLFYNLILELNMGRLG